MVRVLIPTLLCVFSLLAPCDAQDSKAALRAELSVLWHEQRYEELLRRVEPHLLATKAHADLWIMAAEAALKVEDFPRAITCFERGIELVPALEAARINLGFAYLRVDRLDDARKIFDAFLADPNKVRSAKAHYGLGLALAAKDQPEQARKAFVEAAALDPDDARAHYRLGQLALQSGEFAKAVDAFRNAIGRDELHRGAAYGLARAYALLGDGPAASLWTGRHRKILEVDDAVTGMIGRLGEALDPVAARLAIAARLREAEAHKKADAWLRTVLKLDPGNVEARRGLEAAQTRAESRR